jgi:hypothetical protein
VAALLVKRRHVLLGEGRDGLAPGVLGDLKRLARPPIALFEVQLQDADLEQVLLGWVDAGSLNVDHEVFFHLLAFLD